MSEPERIYSAFLRRSTVHGIRLTNTQKAIQAAYLEGRKHRERELLNPDPAEVPKPEGVRDWNSLSLKEKQRIVNNWKR